jgi:prephenate dehydrogenase
MGDGQVKDDERTPVIAIVGLDRVGVALGHALQRVKTRYRVVGHDRDADLVRAAMDAGALDRGSWNLAEVVSEADLVFLAEPVDDLLRTLADIAPHLRPGTLVTDTAGTKVEILRRAAEVLPEGVSFIGGHPVLRRDRTIAPADADAAALFEGASYCLVPLPNASDDAMRVLGNLVAAIGAQPYFIDAQEHDALMAGVSQMPYVLGSALMRVVDRSPSAHDLRRLAGQSFLDAIYFTDQEARGQRAGALINAGSLVRWIDQVTESLLEIRHALSDGDAERLESLLAAADEARHRWEFPPDEQGADARGFEALDDYSPLRDLLLGRRRHD